MPRNFYVLPDDRGWWAISKEPFISDHGRSFPSPNEAFDRLRDIIEAEGLVMGRRIPEGMGFRVEALEPPILYSADALKAIELIKEQFGQALRKRALAEAKRDDRRLVTTEDVLSALESMKVTADMVDLDEEDDNG